MLQLKCENIHCKNKIDKMTILLVSTVTRIYQLVGCTYYYRYTHANVVTTLVLYTNYNQLVEAV